MLLFSFYFTFTLEEGENQLSPASEAAIIKQNKNEIVHNQNITLGLSFSRYVWSLKRQLRPIKQTT